MNAKRNSRGVEMESSLVAYQYNALKHQLYLGHYERHFKDLAQRRIKLLELGVYKGGSLLLWRDYFEHGQIVGLDLNEVHIGDSTGRIKIYQGDQQDLELLDQMARECAPDGFDIIIDDASHLAELTKISFWHLFDNHLKPGGYYVIEDWRVSYWDAWPDGAKYEWPDPIQARARQFSSTTEPKSHVPFYDGRMVDFLKRLLDAVGPDTFNTTVRRLYRKAKYKSRRFPSHDYGMVGFAKQLMDELGMDAITNPLRNGCPPQRFPKFQRMEVCPGQVFIVKATEEDNRILAEYLRHDATVQQNDLDSRVDGD